MQTIDNTDASGVTGATPTPDGSSLLLSYAEGVQVWAQGKLQSGFYPSPSELRFPKLRATVLHCAQSGVFAALVEEEDRDAGTARCAVWDAECVGGWTVDGNLCTLRPPSPTADDRATTTSPLTAVGLHLLGGTRTTGTRTTQHTCFMAVVWSSGAISTHRVSLRSALRRSNPRRRSSSTQRPATQVHSLACSPPPASSAMTTCGWCPVGRGVLCVLGTNADHSSVARFVQVSLDARAGSPEHTTTVTVLGQVTLSLPSRPHTLQPGRFVTSAPRTALWDSTVRVQCVGSLSAVQSGVTRRHHHHHRHQSKGWVGMVVDGTAAYVLRFQLHRDSVSATVQRLPVSAVRPQASMVVCAMGPDLLGVSQLANAATANTHAHTSTTASESKKASRAFSLHTTVFRASYGAQVQTVSLKSELLPPLRTVGWLKASDTFVACAGDKVALGRALQLTRTTASSTGGSIADMFGSVERSGARAAVCVTGESVAASSDKPARDKRAKEWKRNRRYRQVRSLLDSLQGPAPANQGSSQGKTRRKSRGSVKAGAAASSKELSMLAFVEDPNNVPYLHELQLALKKSGSSTPSQKKGQKRAAKRGRGDSVPSRLLNLWGAVCETLVSCGFRSPADYVDVYSGICQAYHTHRTTAVTPGGGGKTGSEEKENTAKQSVGYSDSTVWEALGPALDTHKALISARPGTSHGKLRDREAELLLYGLPQQDLLVPLLRLASSHPVFFPVAHALVDSGMCPVTAPWICRVVQRHGLLYCGYLLEHMVLASGTVSADTLVAVLANLIEAHGSQVLLEETTLDEKFATLRQQNAQLRPKAGSAARRREKLTQIGDDEQFRLDWRYLQPKWPTLTPTAHTLARLSAACVSRLGATNTDLGSALRSGAMTGPDSEATHSVYTVPTQGSDVPVVSGLHLRHLPQLLSLLALWFKRHALLSAPNVRFVYGRSRHTPGMAPLLSWASALLDHLAVPCLGGRSDPLFEQDDQEHRSEGSVLACTADLMCQKSVYSQLAELYALVQLVHRPVCQAGRGTLSVLAALQAQVNKQLQRPKARRNDYEIEALIL